MKKQVEYFDTDFLCNKIEIGDKVIFVAPGYRDFVIGTVVTKAPKSCQIEYINDWNFEGEKLVVRQGYNQIIKYPIKEGKWIEHIETLTCCEDDVEIFYECSCCGIHAPGEPPYCPNCGATMTKSGGMTNA